MRSLSSRRPVHDRPRLAGPEDPGSAGPPHHRRWTQSDITDLRLRIQGGASVADLVKMLQRGAADVAAMTARLRLVPTAAPARPSEDGSVARG